MLQKSTIQLLRFHFSFFLLPVYLFAVSQTLYTNWWKAFLVFLILHVLVYPASNGYNSFMDRDEGPIGGVKAPLAPTRQLFQVVLLMDLLAILLGVLVSAWFAIGVLVYILASRAYSSRSIRLKRFPVLGFAVVVVCQGGLVFWMVYHGVHANQPLEAPAIAIVASSLLIAGAYPLTQIYQHEADRKDGVTTISMLVGIKGTFRLSAFCFFLAFCALGLHFGLQLELPRFLVLLLVFMPVLVCFLYWARRVWRDPAQANYEQAMKMNTVAALCSNAGFLMILIWKLFD
jgi:1,4-dihydroxy-2-naphthoate octaprenyltransferase